MSFIGAADENAIKASIACEADACIQVSRTSACPNCGKKLENLYRININWKSKGKLASVGIKPLEHFDEQKDLEAALRASANGNLLPKANTDAQASTLTRYVNELETEPGRLKMPLKLFQILSRHKALLMKCYFY